MESTMKNKIIVCLLAVFALSTSLYGIHQHVRHSLNVGKMLLLEGAFVKAAQFATDAVYNNIDSHRAVGWDLGKLAKIAPKLSSKEFEAYLATERLKKETLAPKSIKQTAIKYLGYSSFKKVAYLCDRESGQPLHHTDGQLVHIPYLDTPAGTFADWTSDGKRGKELIPVVKFAIVGGTALYGLYDSPAAAKPATTAVEKLKGTKKAPAKTVNQNGVHNHYYYGQHEPRHAYAPRPRRMANAGAPHSNGELERHGDFVSKTTPLLVGDRSGSGDSVTPDSISPITASGATSHSASGAASRFTSPSQATRVLNLNRSASQSSLVTHPDTGSGLGTLSLGNEAPFPSGTAGQASLS